MLNFPRKELILSLTLLVILSACAKKPEAPFHPSVKIAIEKKGDDKIFAVTFTCGLRNENDSTAFTNLEGIIAVKDNNSGAEVLTVPFKSPAILPFDTGTVQERIELTSDQVNPLLDLLDKQKKERKPDLVMDKEQKIEIKKCREILESGEEVEEFIEKQNIIIKKLNLEEKEIIELLRSKL